MPRWLSAAPTKAHKKITNVQYKHSTETDYLKEKEPNVAIINKHGQFVFENDFACTVF